jgi:sortase A
VSRSLLWGAALLLAALGSWQVASAAWIHSKAIAAQRLIAWSWEEARDGGISRRPWPGADTRPIARLIVPSQGIELYVLADASGRSLAFGPAHVSGTARPGSWGNVVIVGHRDTHFAFLRDISPETEILLESSKAAPARYRVREITVVDKSETRVMDPADAAELTLITCYPFDAIAPGTPLRYVVIAERVA